MDKNFEIGEKVFYRPPHGDPLVPSKKVWTVVKRGPVFYGISLNDSGRYDDHQFVDKKYLEKIDPAEYKRILRENEDSKNKDLFDLPLTDGQLNWVKLQILVKEIINNEDVERKILQVIRAVRQIDKIETVEKCRKIFSKQEDQV